MNKQLPIITVPNPSLLEVSKPVTSFDSEFKKQAQLLRQTLKNADYGIGLAASQVGFKNAFFVVEYDDPKGKETIPLQFFVNPEIVECSDEIEEMEEGCLSVPGIFLPIERPGKIKIRARDLNGKKFRLTAKGLLARLLQHETDHLYGKVFTQLGRQQLHSKFPELRNLKIVFIGTGSFAEVILRGLILLSLNIRTVITETAKPSGRKQEICHSPIAETAKLFKQKLIETDDINSSIDNLKKENPDLIILADFGQIIPPEILKIPKICAINLHPSLLPKYRGSTPIQSAILAGEKETGVSIIKMSEKIDQGGIIFQEAIEISSEDNSLTLRNVLANLALKMLIKLLPNLQTGKFTILPQNEKEATKTIKIKKENGQINWKKSAKEIDRQIRAYFGWPGAYTFIDNKRLIVHEAHIEDKKLVLDIVQLEGKRPMAWTDFLRGYKNAKPEWLSKMLLENK